MNRPTARIPFTGDHFYYDAKEADAYMDHLEVELTQLRAERDEWKTRCLTSEASEEDAQKAAAQLRAERERLLEYLGRIRPLAKSIALISEADQDVKDMADSIWTISIAALTQREGGEDDHR